MTNIPESIVEWRRLKNDLARVTAERDEAIERAERAEKDIWVLKGALGYPVPCAMASDTDVLSDGTTPKCGMCDARAQRDKDGGEWRFDDDMVAISRAERDAAIERAERAETLSHDESMSSAWARGLLCEIAQALDVPDNEDGSVPMELLSSHCRILRGKLGACNKERDSLRAEVERLRKIEEAAKAWLDIFDLQGASIDAWKGALVANILAGRAPKGGE